MRVGAFGSQVVGRFWRAQARFVRNAIRLHGSKYQLQAGWAWPTLVFSRLGPSAWVRRSTQRSAALDTSIPRITGIARLDRVPVPHTNDAHYALDGSGRRWVAKREIDLGCEALLAEALTWLLARRIGVPAPDAAFCDALGERAWLSAWVPDAKHWSAATAGQIRNPMEAAAILALDAVVCNPARHAGNILTVADATGGSVVWAIDADEALIGDPAELQRYGMRPPDPRILAPGFPPGDWRSWAMDAALQMRDLANAALAAMTAEACAVAMEPQVELVCSVLQDRCRHAVELTHSYLCLLEGRQ